MSAFRIFSRFAELLDINVTRAAAAWLRLNADGTVTERTAAQVLSDIGGAASSHAHPYVDVRPASDEFMVSSSAYFDAGNNLTLSSLDSHRLKIGNDDMPSYTEVLILPDASSMEGEVVIVWNTRSATQTVKNADEITLGTIGAGNCALLSCDGETWTFTTMSQRMLLTLAEISPLPVANGGTGAATAPLARAALGITEYGDPVVTATSKGAAQTAIGIVNMTPAAYTALVVAGTVDATTLYLLTE